MTQVEMMSPPPCPLGPEYLDMEEDQPISSMHNMSPDLAEYPDEGMTTLLPCITCNRTFNPVSLQRHIKVCEKLSTKQRHVFESNKKRLDDLESPRGSPSRDATPPKVKSRWREKRAEFLRAIRAAKNTSDDDEGGRRNSVPSDYLQCPFCTRHFGPKAAERHIDWCREQRNRLPKSVTSDDLLAIAKMKARIKYVPPRPGQSGWKVPKKKDVISSIPPQNSGANVTPSGRLVTPPLPNYRQHSPPPMSPSRKASSSSLPPGPPRYGTSSLGRAAGKQFASMLQSVTGSSTGYGQSSGYGSSMYGGSSSPANSSYSQTPFQRTSSLRIPRKKYGMGQKMARHRDLASDMLASVMGGGGKRGEPEGDEAGSLPRSYERRSQRLEDKPYDPFSAAELQFQSLLSPPKGQRRKATGMMGSTGSLKHIGLASRSPERDFGYNNYPKPRSTSLSTGHHTLSMLGLNSYGMPPSVIEYNGQDSTEHSPIELVSPEDNLDILSRISSAKSPHFSPNRSPYGLSPSRSPSRFSPNRSSPTRITNSQREKSPYKSSPRAQSLEPFNELILSLEQTAGNRKPADGANLNKLSPLRTKTYPKKKSLGEYNSPLSQTRDNKLNEYNGNSSNYGWINTPDFDGSKNFSKNFGRDTLKDRTSADGMYSSSPSAAYDSLKAIRESFSNDLLKKDFMGSDDGQQRTSSGSSTDSSFPPVSSPMSSSSPSDKNHVMSQMTRFCHECGHKYPVDMAKFCCQCGIRRINV